MKTSTLEPDFSKIPRVNSLRETALELYRALARSHCAIDDSAAQVMEDPLFDPSNVSDQGFASISSKACKEAGLDTVSDVAERFGTHDVTIPGALNIHSSAMNPFVVADHLLSGCARVQRSGQAWAFFYGTSESASGYGLIILRWDDGGGSVTKCTISEWHEDVAQARLGHAALENCWFVFSQQKGL